MEKTNNATLDDLLTADQRSAEWRDERLTRFTSSEMSRLMSPGYRLMTEDELAARPAKGEGSKTTRIEDLKILSDGALTYIREKVAETFIEMPVKESYGSAIDWGVENEEQAGIEFSARTGRKVAPCGFIPFSTFAGGTADLFEIDGNDIVDIVEIKCPFNATNHLDFLLIKTVDELIEKSEDWYIQCQANIMFAQRLHPRVKGCHFVSFDPRWPRDLQMKTIYIPMNVQVCKRISIKLESAVVERDKYVKLVKSIKV